MHLKSFNGQIQKLALALSGELPGFEAHSKMAPSHRDRLISNSKGPDFARKSGVLILLFPDDKSELNTVFIKRNEYDGVHSGQIAFPGGKYEESDPDIIATALREAEEEVGISSNAVKIIGQLSDLFVPPSNFMISPVVARLDFKPELIADKSEVAEIFTVPLTHFLNKGSYGDYMISYKKELVNVPGYYFKNHLIWGATAMILSELLQVYTESNRIP
ncbi:MAG: CoA pyrophosphatase [Bacteroidetes bacterium HGW-Bacteroidetes-9]|nr:MAG: CoA pyrophosphatase [Bacteroidetes bacterium HGW-Bacteroidetes-9]